MTLHGTPRVAAVMVAVAVAWSLLVLPSAGASTPDNPAPGYGTTHGWRSPTNPAVQFDLVPRCDENYRINVGVRTRMWSNGARVNGFDFKVRLVQEGSDGHIIGSAWSDNTHVSFNPGGTHAKTVGRNTPSEDGFADWVVEVKMKFSRNNRPDYRYKFRVPIGANPCDPFGGF